MEDFPVDIFTVIGGGTFAAWLPHLRWFERGTVRIPFLDAEALIAMKSQSVRSKDQEDVVVLRRMAAAAGSAKS